MGPGPSIPSRDDEFLEKVRAVQLKEEGVWQLLQLIRMDAAKDAIAGVGVHETHLDLQT